MKIFKKFIIGFVLLIITALVVYFISASTIQPAVQNGSLISPQEVKKSIEANEKVAIVDVRRPDEYKQGHIKESLLLPLDTIEAKAGSVLPDKNQLLYVYCRTGRRSQQAVSILQQKGYTNAHSMDGGIVAWEELKYPVIKLGNY